MGKTMEKVRMWNILDAERIEKGELSPLEIDAQIDNGSVRVVLPREVSEKLGLRKVSKTKVRYADMRIAERDVVGGLRIEILGRIEDCTAIVEPERTTPLIGQIVLESLDLWIDSRNGRLIPNPESPDMPLLDELRSA